MRAALCALAVLPVDAGALQQDAGPCATCNNQVCAPCKPCANVARDAACPACAGGTCASCWEQGNHSQSGGKPCLGGTRQYCCRCWLGTCKAAVPPPVVPPAPATPAPPPAPPTPAPPSTPAPPLPPAPAPAAGPTVDIPGVGAVAGSSASGVRSFKGIPYAAPPVGAGGRWQPPADPAPWSGTRGATAFGSTCLGSGQKPAAEDCLFLNVYTPEELPATPLPTMVWIHGGAYVKGSGNTYNGPALVTASNGSVVVVTINYRLNVFGFAGSKVLAGSDGGTGNYGIQDQRKALEWVKAHIAAFGGDAGNVLIFGESAGGNSVTNHLAQPASFGLYHRAVIESGTYYGSRTIDQAEAAFAAIQTKLKCTTAACARAAPASAVESAAGAGWGPVVDGVSLADDPRVLFETGKWNTKVPVMLGSNRDERAFWSVLELKPKKMTEAAFERAAGTAAPGQVAKVKQLYAANGSYPYPADLNGYSHWYWASLRVETDGALGLGACSVRLAAKDLTAANPSVWTYLFAHPAQHKGVPGTGPGSHFVPHASEIGFVFGDGGTAAGEPELSLQMSGYWVRFARTGDPNGAGALEWPKFTAAGDHVMRFDTAPGTFPDAGGTAVQTGLRKEACDFWEANRPTRPPTPYMN